MQTENDTSKPKDSPEQVTGEGCQKRLVRGSLTPETDAMVAADQHHIEDDNWITMSCYWRMSDLARTLERERDEWRKKAVDLHARYKGALEDIEAEIAARDEARRLAKEACELLDREGYQVNYPPMPWEPDSPEYVEPDSPANACLSHGEGEKRP
jgi:hypothetical protein